MGETKQEYLQNDLYLGNQNHLSDESSLTMVMIGRWSDSISDKLRYKRWNYCEFLVSSDKLSKATGMFI